MYTTVTGACLRVRSSVDHQGRGQVRSLAEDAKRVEDEQHDGEAHYDRRRHGQPVGDTAIDLQLERLGEIAGNPGGGLLVRKLRQSFVDALLGFDLLRGGVNPHVAHLVGH